MEVYPLILIILGVSGVYSDSHSLWYYETGLSSPISGLPVFSIIGYVDDKEISNYNSDTRQNLPKTEWMKKVEPEYWEGQTQRGRSHEAIFKHIVPIAMSLFNQTGGIHTVQMLIGCEQRDDGSTAGYMQIGYDGMDSMYLDTERGIWIPIMNEAENITQNWNSPDMRYGKHGKNFLQNECIEWLEKYINIGRKDLEKRVRPEVKVWGHQQSDGVTRLQCLVYGFHPRAVDVKWVRNEVDHIPYDEMTPILPHPDGTYQIKVSAEVPTTEGDTYSCHVDHSSLGDDTLSVIWYPPGKGLSAGAIAGIAIGVIVLLGIIAVGLRIYTKKRSAEYTDFSASGLM